MLPKHWPYPNALSFEEHRERMEMFCREHKAVTVERAGSLPTPLLKYPQPWSTKVIYRMEGGRHYPITEKGWDTLLPMRGIGQLPNSN